jgi:general secretion pathway protein E
MTDAVRKLIFSSDFSLSALETQARNDGMITMFQDGLRKAAQGLTTIDEVLRVIRE